MAYAKARKNGRFTAVYVDQGRELSAGTFDLESKALQVAEEQEAFVTTGRKGVDPATRATMTIAEYALPWLSHHRIEPSTRGSYRSVVKAHIVPQFGKVRVAELSREAVRGYLTTLADQGYSVAMQRTVRSVLSAMMSTAWDDGYRTDNPVRGLRVTRGSRKKIIVMSPAEFEKVYPLVPTVGARLLAWFTVSTGCRFGEAAALVAGDFDWANRTVTFDKALQDVGKEDHPDGKSRFHVAPYTKNHSARTIDVDPETLAQMRNWIATNDLGPDDLIFPRSLVMGERKARARRVNIDLTPVVLARIGTFVAPNGKEYAHGTMNGYITGLCHCDYCKQGFADYRYELNQKRKRKCVSPKANSERFYDTTDYLYDGRWNDVWQKACAAAGLTFVPTAYQLRHTHASWLIAKGDTPALVMARLGHSDLSVTSLYVHTVAGSSSSANIMSGIMSGLDLSVA